MFTPLKYRMHRSKAQRRPLEFEGFTYSYAPVNGNESDYISLDVGQSFEATIDLNKIYKFPDLDWLICSL